MHKRWNSELVKILLKSDPGKNYLDLCSGTGEIALNLLKKAPRPLHAYLLDFCPEMLECAQAKAGNLLNQLSCITADVCSIPLDSNFADCASMAYGIRNVKDVEKCIQEIFRVLKPKATLAILELTQPKNPILKFGHSLYLRTILPLFGKFLTADRDAYEYLCNSIHHFIKPEELAKQLKKHGFSEVECRPLHGGIATIITAKK
jgi:demethylmenaquinone methyltransferase/2-methoxy-6-polyprenyl-1,4-benzoquinol methylase